MPLSVITPTPAKLLKQIKMAIDARAIRTWSYNVNGDFTHTPSQWKDQAWLRPVIALGCLQFVTVLPKGGMKQGIEGVYQGRFSSMLQNHFEMNALVSSAQMEAANQRRTGSSKPKRRIPANRSRTGAQPNAGRRKITGRVK